MIITQLGSHAGLTEAVAWYKVWGDVLLSNQVEVVISVPGWYWPVGFLDSKLHVVSMSIPPLGLSLSMSDVTGYIQQMFSRSALSITYVVPVGLYPEIFNRVYSESKTINGVPVFVPVSNRPAVFLRTTSTARMPSKIIARFEGCMFSFPQFQPNLAGNDALQFTVHVNYYNYILDPK